MLISLSFALVAGCSGGGGGGGGVIETATITGTVSGTIAIAVDQNDVEVDRDTATGTPKTFTLTVPVGGEYRIYIVENDGTPNLKVYSLYAGSTNVFSITEAVAIDLGQVTVDPASGKASPSNNPIGQPGCSGGGSQAAIPPKLNLAGMWESSSFASGPGEPWWSRGGITVGSDGSFSGTLTEYDGSPDAVSGSFGVSPGGTITISVNPSFRGSMDRGGTVVVGTDTWQSSGAGTTEMVMMTKKAGSYSMSDLAGAWEANDLGAGPGHWWSRGALTITAGGSYSGTLEDSDGGSEATSGSMSISSGGIVTYPADPGSRGSLDAGKTVLVVTDTAPDVSSHITVLLKKAGSYSTADLAGTWEAHALGAGPSEHWWARGVLTINASGGASGKLSEDDGSQSTISDMAHISPAGIVTISGDPTARGSMDAGKTVIAFTSTAEGDSPELVVLVKKDRSDLDSGGTQPGGGDGGSKGLRIYMVEGSTHNASVYGGPVPKDYAEAEAIAASPETNGYTYLGGVGVGYSGPYDFPGDYPYFLIKVTSGPIYPSFPWVNIDTFQMIETSMFWEGCTSSSSLGWYGSGAYDSDRLFQDGMATYAFGPPDGRYMALYGWSLIPAIGWAPCYP